MKLTFLGTGTSVGIPMIGCSCATCTSEDPRDTRWRSSVMIECGGLRWVVDTGPEFRLQCLRAGFTELDAVLFTHAHMDHVTGFDELRRFTLGRDASIPVYAREPTLESLKRMFDYAFNGENRYPGYLKPEPRPITGSFTLGEGREEGATTVTPLPVSHGKVDTIGFLFDHDSKRLAYIPDCKVPAPETVEALRTADVLVIDALRFTSHPTHMNFEEALALCAEVGVPQCYLTHFTCEVNHALAERDLPEGIALAYDGLYLTL